MKKLLYFAAIVCAMVLSSCSSHFYQSSNENVSKTEIVLSQKNFRVIGQACGNATSTKILMIGGLSKKSVRSNAVARMFENAELSGSQTIININMKRAEVGFPPFYWRSNYTATGTIIEFVDNTPNPQIVSVPQQNKEIIAPVKLKETSSLYGLYKDNAVIVELSDDGKHGKAIKTFDIVSSYENAQLECQEFEIGAGWRLPNVIEMLSIMKSRDAINKTLKAENLILISSKYNYWCYATVPTIINAKTLQTETCSNKNIAYDFIAILDF